jgi:hypothetical protein
MRRARSDSVRGIVNFVNSQKEITESAMPNGNGKISLTEKQAAERLNVPVTTLRYWRGCSDGPEYYKLGGAKRSPVRYDADVLEAWLQAHLRVPKARATAKEKYVAL